MKIGELAEATGVSRRLLRYYEEQRLIAPGRDASGYRDYGAEFVDRVAQIRGLLDAGIPTAIIRDLLPCLDRPRALHPPYLKPEMVERLRSERDAMADRVECLTRNRDAIDAYLAAAVIRDGAPG